jgi:hypothetical protein
MDEEGASGSNIIAHDFGHSKRMTARTLRRQLDLDALHEENVRKNPLPYLERASERIFQLEKALFEAHSAAARQHGSDGGMMDRIDIRQTEYACLIACRDIVARAFEAFVQAKIRE